MDSLGSNPAWARTHKNTTKSKNHIRTHISKHKKSAEEETAAKEAADREAQEVKLNESRNLILAKAYRLYDSGTSESLQGNHKYAVLQLKLADELLQEHGQANTSLEVATLLGLASSAQAAKDYPLAKSTCERLLNIRPQDSQILLILARIEMSQGNFRSAQNKLSKVVGRDPNNAEAKVLIDLINNKSKYSNIKGRAVPSL